MTVSDCLEEYKIMGDKIFGKPRPVSQRNTVVAPWTKYSHSGMKEAFEDVTNRRGEQRNGVTPVIFPSNPDLCKTHVPS